MAYVLYLSVVMSWSDRKTDGLGYYGLPVRDRRAFKRRLGRHAVLLHPLLRLMGRLQAFRFENASFRYQDISGPKGTCTPESFAAAGDYEPRPEDVFVVTPMRCGTTWMQHVVYQTLNRGRGDLVGTDTTLYAVSPWLEAVKGVEVGEAPTVGSERPARIIKTHLPAHLCPDRPEARYIHVSRHVTSCFASCVDFLGQNLGVFRPDLEAIEEWFCSDELMWWGTWPDHVEGWRARARGSDNVLLVEFEEMKADLAAVVRRVAGFLDLAPLDDGELADVLQKCSFEYMREHRGIFEMHPPHLLAVDAELFVRGSADRHRDVPEEVDARIARWSAARLDEARAAPPHREVAP